MVLIGLMAGKGSGKSTAANYMINNYNFVEKSMAEPLKKACKELFLFTDDQLFGTQEQKETPDPRWFGCSPRKALQYVGTDLIRNNLDNIMPGLDKNIFIHHFKLWYEQEMRKNPNICVVISDIRYQNEADFIHELGGILIKIIRHFEKTVDMHSSEIELQSITTYDHLIENIGTLPEYYSKLDNILVNKLGVPRKFRNIFINTVVDIAKTIPIMKYFISKYNFCGAL